MNRREVLEILREYFRDNAQKYGLKRLGLFGSVARGEARDTSDVDVVVEFERPNLFHQAAIMLDLRDRFGCPVDVVALWKRMNPRLKHRIEEDVIYV
jgi:predicted nucleotidyltransferase